MPPKTRFSILVGALNFRDMGGYPGKDGRLTRWNTLFRSGSTHQLTPEDIRQLASMGVRYAYDLRSNGERAAQPSAMIAVDGIKYSYHDHDRLPGNITDTLTQAGLRSEDTTALMLSLYRRLPFDFRDAFRALFGHLANGDLPLVINCTAGKDRTGAAAALVLSALGVPQELVYEDYLVSEQFFERSCEIVLSGHLRDLFASMDRQVWEPIMRAKKEYLDAMFDQISLSCGSVANYLSRELGISANTRDLICSYLLE